MSLWLANTDFEFELSGNLSPHISPIVLQLQYLPILFADTGDAVLVSSSPLNFAVSRPEISLIGFDSITQWKGRRLQTWGASQKVKQWADENNLIYEIPNWEVVKTVNSKAFSFMNSPRLPDSELLYSFDEVRHWIGKIHGTNGVLKTCFGVSGKGHFHLFAEKKIDEVKLQHFLKREFSNSRPVIAEPWVHRVLDFSSQWKIESPYKIEFLGLTFMRASSSGTYKGTWVGLHETREYREMFDVHLTAARQLLQKTAEMGYFGFAGIDAMIYLHEDQILLHPVVELNARMTMGLVAVLLHKLEYPCEAMGLSFERISQENPSGLLPASILFNGKEMTFSHQLQKTFKF